MQYREIKPKPPLSEFVECFWTLEGDGRSQPEADLILPDGCVEMVLNFADPFCEHKQHEKQTQPKRLVVGQMTGPMRIGPTGAVQLIGVRFNPGGTLPFFSVQAEEMTNRYAPLDDVAADLDREVAGRACDASSLEHRVARLAESLSRRLQTAFKTRRAGSSRRQPYPSQ